MFRVLKQTLTSILSIEEKNEIFNKKKVELGDNFSFICRLAEHLGPSLSNIHLEYFFENFKNQNLSYGKLLFYDKLVFSTNLSQTQKKAIIDDILQMRSKDLSIIPQNFIKLSIPILRYLDRQTWTKKHFYQEFSELIIRQNKTGNGLLEEMFSHPIANYDEAYSSIQESAYIQSMQPPKINNQWNTGQYFNNFNKILEENNVLESTRGGTITTVKYFIEIIQKNGYSELKYFKSKNGKLDNITLFIKDRIYLLTFSKKGNWLPILNQILSDLGDSRRFYKHNISEFSFIFGEYDRIQALQKTIDSYRG